MPGARVLPGIVLGSSVASLLAWPGPLSSWHLLAAGCIGLAAAAQAAVGARILRGLRHPVRSPLSLRPVLSLLLLGGLVACLINATVGVLVLDRLGLLEGGAVFGRWATWWLGDAAGVLLAAPLCLAIFDRATRPWRGHVAPVVAALAVASLVLVVAHRSVESIEEHRVQEEVDNLARATQPRLPRRRAGTRSSGRGAGRSSSAGSPRASGPPARARSTCP